MDDVFGVEIRETGTYIFYKLPRLHFRDLADKLVGGFRALWHDEIGPLLYDIEVGSVKQVRMAQGEGGPEL